MTLQEYISDKKYLFWYVSDTSELSDEIIIEHIIRYWTWEDLKFALKTDKNFALHFENILSKKRCDLTAKQINFISLILKNGKYSSWWETKESD